MTVPGLARELGGLGLLAMGVVDNSLIPTPGGQDLLVVVLAAAHRDWWPYYAGMATLGALLGSLVAYWVGLRGGEQALRRALSAAQRERIGRAFGRFGFGALFFPAVMPPPVPIGPFLLGAGALRYPLGRFVVALTLARGLRYTAVAYLASLYGRRVVALAEPHYFVVLGVVLTAAALALVARPTRDFVSGRSRK